VPTSATLPFFAGSWCQSVDFLVLMDYRPATLIVCLYAGFGYQRQALMEILQTLHNLCPVPMRFKEYNADDSKFKQFQPNEDYLTDCARYHEEQDRDRRAGKASACAVRLGGRPQLAPAVYVSPASFNGRGAYPQPGSTAIRHLPRHPAPTCIPKRGLARVYACGGVTTCPSVCRAAPAGRKCIV
jgi:hypothetical protein